MAVLFEINKAEWLEWLKSRPPVVKEIGERFPPNKLYRMKTTGQRVTMYSINENGTVTVDISGQFNLIDFERRVFGVDPNNLEECDLPASDEPVGTFCNEEQANRLIEARIAVLHREGKQHNTERCPLCRTMQ